MKKILSIILAISILFALANPVSAARDFAEATGDHVDVNGNAGISAYPFTMSACVKLDSFVTFQRHIATLYKTNTGSVDYGLQPTVSSGNKFRIYARNSTYITAVGSTTVNTGQWYHLVGVWASATDRRLYLDGVQDASSTTSVTFNTGVNQFSFGAKTDNSPNNSINGKAGCGGLWAAELTTNEITALANGAKPHEVQPASLKVYWPMWGSSPEPDLSGNGNNGTVAGTSIADHFGGPYVHP